MSDAPEPLAAILAEMREYFDLLKRGLIPDNVARMTTRQRHQFWADRIEAAAARERDEDRQLAAIAESDEAFARCARCDRPERAPGDAAAMRAALEQAIAYCESDQKSGIAYSDNDILVPILRAALSAPARNCDRFANADEAREAYWAYREPLEFNDKPFVAITEWLFATAKGGDHA